MTKVPLFGWPNWTRIVGSAVRATKLSSAPIRRASRIPTATSSSNRTDGFGVGVGGSVVGGESDVVARGWSDRI